jgi:hypothetical protein
MTDYFIASLSVSNSLSGRLSELDQILTVGDPTHIVQLGTGLRRPTACRPARTPNRTRLALQRLDAALANFLEEMHLAA